MPAPLSLAASLALLLLLRAGVCVRSPCAGVRLEALARDAPCCAGPPTHARRKRLTGACKCCTPCGVQCVRSHALAVQQTAVATGGVQTGFRWLRDIPRASNMGAVRARC